MKAELEGFSTIDYPNIVINIGRNTQIEVKLSAAVEDVITVTAESPLLDERRISTGATVSQTELEKIPTSRDPWSVLQTTRACSPTGSTSAVTRAASSLRTSDPAPLAIRPSGPWTAS